VKTVALLIVSNIFMTLAWYGHLRLKGSLSLFTIIMLSWGVAFFEYCFQVPANRIGFVGNGGPFTLFELKIIQEVLSLTVFTVFALLVFRTETFRLNHLISFIFILLAVFFAFKK
jgi:uncharacterized protein (DUF486 family)